MVYLTREIADKNSGRILVKSADSFLIKEFISYVLGAVYPGYGVYYYSSVEDLYGAISCLNIFSEESGIHVLRALSDDALNSLDSSLQCSSSTNPVLILENDIVSHNKKYTEIKASCAFVSIDSFDKSQCRVWADKKLKSLSVAYDSDIPEYLVTKMGAELHVLDNSIRKLSLLCDGERVTRKFCDQVLFYAGSLQYFEFSDSLFRRKIKEVVDHLQVIGDYEYLKVLHFLISQVHRLYKVAVYKEQGMGVEDIATMMDVPKFIVREKYIIAIGYYGKSRLLKLMSIFNELDKVLRTSKSPKKLYFESYILKALNA